VSTQISSYHEEVSMEIWSGIDVAKKTFEASWVAPETDLREFHRIPHKEFQMSRRGVRQYLNWLQSHSPTPVSIRVIMEATGRYSLKLFSWLVDCDPQLAPAIVNPKQARHFHVSLGLRNKTDSVDARALGLMGRERNPRPYEPPEPPRQELKELMRQRKVLTETLVAEKSRLENAGDARSVRNLLKDHIRYLERLLEKIQTALDKLLERNPSIRRDLELLISIPGVGQITALTVLAELGDLRRFNRSRQVSAMAGLSPHNQNSGTSRNSARMDRMGNPEVRRVLYMAALAATRYENNHLARTYLHLIDDNGLCKMAALVAVMRKMIVLMRALLISNSIYQDDFHSQAKKRSAKK